MSGVVRLRGVASHTSRYRIALYAVGYFSQQQSSLGHFILCLCVRVCVCVGCRALRGYSSAGKPISIYLFCKGMTRCGSGTLTHLVDGEN